MRCPDCGEEHVWSASEAWLDEPTLVPKKPAVLKYRRLVAVTPPNP